MEQSSSQGKTVEHQFDSFCKKLLREERRDFIRAIKRKVKNEILFSEMSQKEIDEFWTEDNYPSDMCNFIVHGFEVAIENELFIVALSKLSKQRRDIVLLSYFLDMSDVEIAETLNIVRRTVQYQRTSALAKLKKYMEG